MDILPRVKENQFAFTSSHLLLGSTVDALLALVIDDMKVFTTADYESLRRVAYNLAVSRRLEWPGITLFHTTLTKTDAKIIGHLKDAGVVSVTEPAAGKARVMEVRYKGAITNDYTCVPCVKERGRVYIKSGGVRIKTSHGQDVLDKINSDNSWVEVTYQPTWSELPVELTPQSITYDRLYIDDLNTYGRFLAPFQSLSKIDRATIRINGVTTRECDFTAMHPMLLYAKINEMPPDDIYDIPGLPSTYRPYIKLGLLITINAKSYEAALSALRERVPGGVDSLSILGGLAKVHPKISKFFWSNAGIWLMNVESEIAEYVLIACCNSGIDVLCIHDGFICKISDSNEVLRLMRRGFRAVTGYAGEVRVGVK